MSKSWSHKLFHVNDKMTISCHAESTRYGFRHLAHLMVNGCSTGDSAKACYYNRTWERFEFQSVIRELAEKAHVSDEDRAAIHAVADGYKEDTSGFSAIAMVAAMGSLLCPDQKGANDWKARMLKAGLGNQGLDMPADWDTLPEDEKERRLNLVINELKAPAQA